ncbi:unnamed protein product [Phytophthora fragariaefolia]|uniref:Unnamed protein product n=1 Tax=Phytophthora fragariaefolia TaxID=1490495 RepID=A0A9W6Y0Z5_9STRA|nr:unnamed protein product [Phytophthora fragariaefolia]
MVVTLHVAHLNVSISACCTNAEVDRMCSPATPSPRWGLTLSHWDLEVRKGQRDEDGLAAILGAGITPREHLDEVAETLIPAKGRVKAPPVISVEMLDDSYTGYVLSFDGAAKTSTRQGSCDCVVWELPGWRALSAHGFILEDVTVNDAETMAFSKEWSSYLNVTSRISSLWEILGSPFSNFKVSSIAISQTCNGV